MIFETDKLTSLLTYLEIKEIHLEALDVSPLVHCNSVLVVRVHGREFTSVKKCSVECKKSLRSNSL